MTNKTAVITGAAGGIGRAIVQNMRKEGFHLVLGDADDRGLAALADELHDAGAAVSVLQGDLRQPSYCAALVDLAITATGRLDVLVNNAGIITRGTILETTDEDWNRTFDINVSAIFHTCRKAIAYMKAQGGGSIVNVSSCWGLYPGPAHAAYCTSKGAVAILTKCLGRDHAADGIRVNAVCPNEVNTPMLRTGFERRGFDPDTAIEALNKTVPLGRIAEPEDIADVIQFLASDSARYVTGTVVEINGAKPVY
jgi:NAD(P)-dependent dehydrogenase (short-subunit alcohol dehydrogenase family)